MKTKLNSLLSLTLLLCVGGCCSARGPQAQQAPAPETTNQQNAASKITSTEADLARQRVQTAKKDYREGRLDSAEKLLRSAIQTDPRNQEGWYYLDRVRRAIWQKQNGSGIWYPT